MMLSPFCLTIDANSKSTSPDSDHRFFRAALVQASFAMGSTHPNPAVGAIVVKDGQILAQGYTHPPGGMHAEKHALTQCAGFAKDATIYVTLEPCCHHGRTPPCTSAIIDAGIKRVVYGVIDPNPKVCGEGITALRDAGVIVQEIAHAELRAMANALIAPFSKWVLTRQPFVVVKIATSADGLFASKSGERTKITGARADKLIHAMRRASDAIVIGANTARIDNPALTARFGDLGHGRQPTPVVISVTGELSPDLKLLHRTDQRSLIVVPRGCAEKMRLKHTASSIEIIELESGTRGLDLKEVFHAVGERGFTLLFVEAGPQLFAQLVEQRLADEIVWLRSPEVFGDQGPKIENLLALIKKNYELVLSKNLDDDELALFR